MDNTKEQIMEEFEKTELGKALRCLRLESEGENIPESKCYACRYGGNKHYNFGFVSGTALYCRKDKEWLHKMSKCPLKLNPPPQNEHPTNR